MRDIKHRTLVLNILLRAQKWRGETYTHILMCINPDRLLREQFAVRKMFDKFERAYPYFVLHILQTFDARHLYS